MTALTSAQPGSPWLAPVAHFRALITDRIGLRFEDDRLAWLDEILARRTRARGCPDAMHYLAWLAEARGHEEWLHLTPELTVGETYFFRHAEQFQALREHILPERLTAARGRVPRILSAGCASGDEAYSIAITLTGLPQSLDQDVQIEGIDINPEVLDKARAGRYRSWSLRETPETTRLRWFREEGEFHVLDERIRQAVHFSHRNLVEEDDSFWRPGSFDVIMCRNVLMYFSTDQLKQTLDRFARAMAPGGYLLLGHAESLRGLTTDFELCQSHGTFYHRKASRPLASTRMPTPLGLSIQTQEMDAVQRHQAERLDDKPPGHPQEVAHLAGGDESRGAPVETTAATKPVVAVQGSAWQGPDLPKDVMRLFTQDRFHEALTTLDAQEGMDADAPPLTQVLHTLLLLHVRRASDAESWCRGALEIHPFHADLQHALALCQAAQGETARAMDTDQRATYLDPSFAMPQLHISMLARQRGDAAGSRQASALALRLLAREDAERIQLFGGGFGREALMQMCRTGTSQSGALS